MYVPCWVGSSSSIFCCNCGFVPPMGCKTASVKWTCGSTCVQLNKHPPIWIRHHWNVISVISKFLSSVNCLCMNLKFIRHFTRRNSSHLLVKITKEHILMLQNKTNFFSKFGINVHTDITISTNMIQVVKSDANVVAKCTCSTIILKKCTHPLKNAHSPTSIGSKHTLMSTHTGTSFTHS